MYRRVFLSFNYRDTGKKKQKKPLLKSSSRSSLISSFVLSNCVLITILQNPITAITQRESVRAKQFAKMGGGMETNKNRWIEDWSTARENLEHNFRWTRRNLAIVGIFGIAVPILVYKGIVREFVSQHDFFIFKWENHALFL